MQLLRPPFRVPRPIFIGALVLSLLAPTRSQADGTLDVLATNTILADIAREVAGDVARVHCLAPPGVDLHGFEPSPGDVALLARADLVLVNGAGFEPWLSKFVEGAAYKGPVLEAVSGVPLLHRHDESEHDAHNHDHGHDEVDPHAWQNPAHGIRYVINIRDVLVQLAPARRIEIEQRARLYIAQLETLDAWMRRLFAGLAPEQRRFLTSHDALGYFGEAYRLEIVPVRGLDSLREPDARQLAALVDLMRAQKIRTIFVESVSNPKLLEQLARDTGATIGGELHTDSLGQPGTPADSYIGMLRENALRIFTALERG